MEKTIELLYNVVMSRKQNATEGSYTAYLFEQGLDKILKKVGEESSEVIIAAKNGDNGSTVYEISDLIYHLIVLMAEIGISPDEIKAELSERAKSRGILRSSRLLITTAKH